MNPKKKYRVSLIMASFTESELKRSVSRNSAGQVFQYCPGPSIAPDAEAYASSGIAEPSIPFNLPDNRSGYEQVVLENILERAIDRLNPAVPAPARREALRAVLSVYSPQLIDANEAFHKMLTEGVPVTVQKDGQERGERVWLVDFQHPEANSYFAINQYTVEENNQNKRPDVILFINGLRLVVIELKNPADEQASIRKG
jgi:type I restriction enzyme R subunit